MNIILHEPEIPANTGNIGRTCAATGSKLHLIRPLGFFLDDRSIKRAGMDYWHELDISYYDDFDDFLIANNNPRIYMATTKAKKVYSEVRFELSDYIMFGKESAGIPEEILLNYPDTSIRIPMLQNQRSLNLANSVSIIVYEALRQNSFTGMLKEGELHRHRWDDK